MNRVPALDGLRGVAILGVLGYHASWLPGGQHGVDVFFVLSGYLITGLLLKDPPLRTFYRRRVGRLAPALLLALAVSSIALWAQGDGRTAATVAVGGGMYVGNLITWLGPFGLTLGMMGPLWSLAVEEQFYLLWPALLRKLSKPALTIWALLVLTELWRLYLYGMGAGRHIYFGTDTRAAALLLGALLAVVPVKARRWHGPAGIVAVGAALALPVTQGFGFLLLMMLAEVGAALLILGLPAMLQWQPLAYCGRISYGLYVYANVTLILLGQHLGDRPGLATDLLWLILTFTAAAASFRWWETPARKWICGESVAHDLDLAQEDVRTRRVGHLDAPVTV